MKKTILYIFAIIALAAQTGCKDDFISDGSLQPSLTARWLSPEKTNFSFYTSKAGSETFSVRSTDTPWEFTQPADWITLAPMRGSYTSDVTLSVTENKNADAPRTSIFYLKSSDSEWNYSRAMSVTQVQATASLTPETTSLTFGGGASQQEVKITANCSWTASSTSSWIKLTNDVSKGVLTVAVEANPQSTYRSGYVSISFGGNKTATINVNQLQSKVVASDYTLEYENVASKYDITIDSDADWTSEVSASWISVKPDKGSAGKTSVAIEVAPNTSVSERSGFVSILTGNNKRVQIELKQKGMYIEADESMTFLAISQTKLLNVHSNTSWQVTSKPEWLTLSKESGQGNAEIYVTSTENPNTTSRTGEIVIGQPGLSVESRVKVTQIGKTLSTEVTLLEFSDLGGQQSFDLVSDAAWTATQSVDWFTTTPMSGAGNAKITVAAQANNTTEERIGTINFGYMNKTVQVTVHQLAKYLNIDGNSFQFDAKGGTHTIDLSTNDEWTATTEASAPWLKLSKTSGTGSAVITLTAEDNASMQERSAVVIINTKYAQSVRIVVTQKARYINVSAQSVSFFAAGGTSEVVTIDTNGTYKITTDASWFTVNKGEGNTFTVVATKNNDGAMRRGKVTITLTDLKSGSFSRELSVMQAGEGGSFIITPYPEDSNWSTISLGSITITVKGYSADQNWNDK